MATLTSTHPIQRTKTRRLPRTTGAFSGFLIILLGLWGAVIPFVGPYFHYAFGSFHTWHYTSARLWLDILPGAVAVIGGLMLLFGATRRSGLIGGWLAAAAGAWFAIGPTVSLLWHDAGNPIGAPLGGHIRRSFELLGYFQGLGVVIVGLAAFAMGRYFSRPAVAEEAGALEEPAAAQAPVAIRESTERVAAREEADPADESAERVAAREEADPADEVPDDPAPRAADRGAESGRPYAGEPMTASDEQSGMTAGDEHATDASQATTTRQRV
jgi:hypothetical protein